MSKVGFHPFVKRREISETQEIVDKIKRIPSAPEETVHRYFNVDLNRLLQLSHRHPQEVKKLLRRSLESSPSPKEIEPWVRMIEAAQGDHTAFLETFEKGDLKTRLALFRITLFSPHVGDGHLIGELFVKLMENSTRQEREAWVEPTLQSIINRGAWARDPKVQNKLNWLKALCHGWQESSDSLKDPLA